MADKNYTVLDGDNLWDIAVKFYGPKGGPKWKEIAKVNNIPTSGNPTVKPGQVLLIPDVPDTGEFTKKLQTSAEISYFFLADGTERTIIAGWRWDPDHVKHYQLKWSYYAYGTWWTEDSTVSYQKSQYTAPDVAEKVKLVVKPVSTTRKVNKKDTPYWTAKWSKASVYSFSNNPPKVPPVPSFKCEGNTLTAEIASVGDINATYIYYQVYKYLYFLILLIHQIRNNH